ncbi:MAG TPA: alpha/beta fold hydrolase [Gemmatimonadaceae bacterium]|nr:alpha/beta fold hydrolase [Gemmatimonadaceae bacterium]
MRRPRGRNGVVDGASGFQLDRPGAPRVLLLHGAGDTPQSLRLLGTYLHERGFAVAAPLLPGHGRQVREFQHVHAADWRRAVLTAYDRLAAGSAWTGIVGLSMGGALAAVVAAERPSADALVLLAPYVDLPPILKAAAVVSRVAWFFSPYFGSADARSVRDPSAAASGLAYGVFTPAAVRALRATARAGWQALARIRQPTLIVQSRHDNRIAPDVPVRALERLAAVDKRLEWLNESGHVITVDLDKERVFALTGDWLATHGAGALLRS